MTDKMRADIDTMRSNMDAMRADTAATGGGGDT
jgi:hypothetical protein